MSDNHLDSAVLASLQDVMEDEYPLLLDTFLADSTERLQSLGLYLSQADSHNLRLAAHSFKGSCSNMGAVVLTDLCRQLEQAARHEQLGLAGVLVEQLEMEFESVSSLLQEERCRY